MTRKNALTTAPPYAVEQTLKRLGANLRTARLRRNQTIVEVAEKIGTGPRAIMDAEKGRPGASAAVYVALLWAYDLLSQIREVGSPALDDEGFARSALRRRARTPLKGGLANDF